MDAKGKDVLEYLRSFHKQRSMIQSDASPEYAAYDGVLLDDSKSTTGKSSTQKAIDSLDVDSFSKLDVRSTATSNDTVKRSIPEGTFVVDGATGSELDRRGVDCCLPLWSATANLVAPEVLKDVHKHYLQNGARAITTNTFRTNERMLGKVGLGHLAKPLTQKAV